MFLILWLCGSVLGFVLIGRAGVRDFGAITRAGLLGLVVVSAIAPVAVLLGLMLTVMGGDGSFWSKQVWPKDGQGNGR